MKRPLTSLVALVSVLSVLAFLANPSAAATSSGSVTAGTMTIALTPPIVIDLSGSGTCSPAAIWTNDTSATSGTFGIAIYEGAFVYNSVNYVFTGSFAGTYTLTNTGGTSYNVSTTVNMTNGAIRLALANTRCVPTGSSKCAGPIAITTFSLTGTATLSSTTAPVGTVSLSGSSTTTAFGCTSPFQALSGKAVTISGLAVTLT